jgi:hypothetical protein
MSLEDDLRAKSLALISQQMANWVVSIQRQIAEHQGNLVRTLDELSESVARYDEKINENEIAQAMSDVVSGQPAPAPAGPSFEQLRASLAAIEKGTSLSEVLTYLVNEVALYVERVAMLIIKGSSAIGWYSKGIEPADAIKQINVPLQADTVFRIVSNARHALRGHVTHSPGTAQHLARLGGSPQGILAVPLILRDKAAAVLYCDTRKDEIPAPEAALVETLTLFAGKSIDLLSFVPKSTVTTRTSAGVSPERAAAIRAGGDEIRERAGIPIASAPPLAPAPPPTPPPAAEPDEGASTVMFKAGAFTAPRPPAPAPPPPVAPLRPAPAPPMAARPAVPAAIAPEDQKAHDDAKRFARLVVSEIKLYNEAKVNEGRRHKDIYERLKEDIERGRQMYSDRVPPHVRDNTTYFFDELVRILAGGDASALGPM